MENKNPKAQVAKYLVCDYLAAFVAWLIFFIYRKISVYPDIQVADIFLAKEDTMFFGIIFIPISWILFYYVAGCYDKIFHRSRLKELLRTIYLSFLGVVVIFFVLILDDDVLTYQNYYSSFFFLLSIHFGLTYIGRISITNSVICKLRHRVIGFPTLIVGSGETALKLYQELISKPLSGGEYFVGYVSVNNSKGNSFNNELPYFGSIDNLITIIGNEKIEEVIVAIEPEEKKMFQEIVVKLKSTNADIYVAPDILDIISGNVKMSSIFGVPLIEMLHDRMPSWQVNVKRIIDVVVSFVAMLLLLPIYLLLAICVKLTSEGPVFYLQERIGRYGKPFNIIKFRTMYVNAEQNGPMLSSKHDPRITKIGRFMRKYRFDEIPQFFNVFRGDMSLVGPRPERMYYIEKIVEKAPHFYSVFRVRPGVTSWGQVKYGYAENVDEMIDRLKYDIIYLENMSLYLDIKILIYTVKTVFEGRGK